LPSPTRTTDSGVAPRIADELEMLKVSVREMTVLPLRHS